MSKPPTPRHIGPYSPRRPSPLGFPPLAPHMAFQQPTYFSWPHTPDRAVQPKGLPNARMVTFPPEARRPPLAGSTQRRRRSQPPIPPPLKLDDTIDEDDNEALPPPPKTTGMMLNVPGRGEEQEMTVVMMVKQRRVGSAAATAAGATQRPLTPPPPSPTESEASTLSLYSSESVDKNFPVETLQRKEGEEKPRSLLCSCFGFLFKKKQKEDKILGPPVPTIVQPAPVPQMSQTGRRRPSPLNL